MAPKPKFFTPDPEVLAASRPLQPTSRVQRGRFKFPTQEQQAASHSAAPPTTPEPASSSTPPASRPEKDGSPKALATTPVAVQPSLELSPPPVTPANLADHGKAKRSYSQVDEITPTKTLDPAIPSSLAAQLEAVADELLPCKVRKTEESTVQFESVANSRLALNTTTPVVCFTGDLETLSQQEAEDRVKAAGGKVSCAVTLSTTFFVVGQRLEDGRPSTDSNKYRNYLKLKDSGKRCPSLLTEAEFIEKFPSSASTMKQAAGGPAQIKEDATEKFPSSSSTSTIANTVPTPTKVSNPKPQVASNWVDAHAPRSLGQLVGNTQSIQKLSDWLRDWEDVVLRGNAKKVHFRQGGGTPEDINARAVLVSGPPGIGKTTTCRLVAELHGGYEVLEYNASDARGQKVIQEMADGIADNTTISFSSSSSSSRSTRKACIIMDEVDGMGAGDKGGNLALIKMIKKTRNPIICICNDQISQKVRSLSAQCYDLKLSRPTKNLVAERCAEIARQQGLKVEQTALEALAESCGSDMRQVLNQLQMLARSSDKPGSQISHFDLKQRLGQLSKDQEVMMGPFDACKKLLNTSEAARLSLNERMELFFVDYSLMNLLVQENYLRSVERKPVNDELLSRMAYSADLFTVGDIMNERINSSQDWSFLPHLSVVSCTFPSFVTNGFLGYPTFPAALGKFSSLSRSKRLAMELQAHLRLTSTVDRKALVTTPYNDLLYKRIVEPLCTQGGAAVESSVNVLDAYGLRKEHVVEHLTELRQHLGGQDSFKQVESKVKAAVTRELNNGSHSLKVVLPSKRRKFADTPSVGPEGDIEVDEDNVDETQADGSGEENDTANLVKVKSKATNSAKAKAKVKTKSKVKALQ